MDWLRPVQVIMEYSVLAVTAMVWFPHVGCSRLAGRCVDCKLLPIRHKKDCSIAIICIAHHRLVTVVVVIISAQGYTQKRQRMCQVARLPAVGKPANSQTRKLANPQTRKAQAAHG